MLCLIAADAFRSLGNATLTQTNSHMGFEEWQLCANATGIARVPVPCREWAMRDRCAWRSGGSLVVVEVGTTSTRVATPLAERLQVHEGTSN